MKRARGVSLIEAVVATAIVMGVLLTVAELYPLAATALVKGKRTVTASALAQMALERARLTPFDALTDSDTAETVDGREYHVSTRFTERSPKVRSAVVTVSCAGTTITYSTCLYDYVNPPP